MNHCHMCSYKFAPYEVEFSDCGQITKFTFYFLPPKCVKSGRVTVGHADTYARIVAGPVLNRANEPRRIPERITSGVQHNNGSSRHHLSHG